MLEFTTGQNARVANKALKSSLKAMEAAKQCSVLWFEEIQDRKLFQELGYSSINQYAKQELGFSSSRTGDYLQLCRSFKKLPKVKEKIKTGELGYTSARVLATVANEENQDGWLQFALDNSRRDLEKEARRARLEAVDDAVGQASLLPVQPKSRPAAAVPVSIHLEMSPTQLARYESLWAKIRKGRKIPADKVEALLEIMAVFADQSSPRGDLSTGGTAPIQMHIHHCPECEKSTVQTSRGELEISKDDLQQAECDCQISEPGKRNRTSIPPSIRRKVMARARFRCERSGCTHTQFLEVHHKIPRAEGGGNHSENLMVVCSTCHALLHRQKISNTEFMVKSPRDDYSWKPKHNMPEDWFAINY